MIKLCDLMGIPLLDHIIVGGDNSEYFSFKGKDILKNPYIYLEKDYKMIDFEASIVAEKGRSR